MTISVMLNGERRELAARSDEMLLEVLRRAGLRSVRLSCGVGVCGSCTCLLDGQPVSTCLLLAPLADGAVLETVEGLADDDPVQRAFDELCAYQCGYCTPGMILTARHLLADHPSPSSDRIREHLNGNTCRCGCYPRIEAAVARAARTPSEETT
jgi:aerobic-type carbon monoxide dehydrogenase small subunit (CoxS/CutS family)